MIKNKRILIFNVNWLGDVLFSTATIRNIRRNYPDSYIACIIPSRCYSILKGNPHLDEIIIFDEKDRHKGIFAKLEFIGLLKSKKFDVVFLLHRSLSRALICRLAGITEVIGYNTKRRGFLLSKKIPLPRQDSMHRIDHYLNIIEQSGLRVEDRYTEFFISEADMIFARDFYNKQGLAPKDFVVGINPGGNWLPKRWPKEFWAQLADKLIKQLGAKVIIAGGPQDMELAGQIKSLMQEAPIISTGLFNIKQLGALLKKVNVFVTADTGPLHIADALEAENVIAIFGPTSCELTGPRVSSRMTVLQKDVGCKVPCYEVDCQQDKCMKAVGVDEVFERIKAIKVKNVRN